jgi:hypothetical protein
MGAPIGQEGKGTPIVYMQYYLSFRQAGTVGPCGNMPVAAFVRHMFL